LPSYTKKPYVLDLPCSGFLSSNTWAHNYQYTYIM